MKSCFTYLAVVIALTGCSTATMKPPSSVTQSQRLAIQGHSGNTQTFREKNLEIGSYSVSHIDRDWDKGTQTNAGPWSRASNRKAYRFDVGAAGRLIHAECNEQAVSQDIAGIGQSKVTFACECREGSDARAKVDLVDGVGTARIAGIPYEITAVYESEQGGRSGTALGYHFKAPEGDGAVDVTGKGRAWLPTAVTDETTLGLVCAYAGLLLYRPTQ